MKSTTAKIIHIIKTTKNFIKIIIYTDNIIAICNGNQTAIQDQKFTQKYPDEYFLANNVVVV